MRTKTVVAFVLTVSCALLFIGWIGTRTYQAIDFGRDIGGHLKRASNANTVELAKKELKISLDAIESQGLTHGYTSILWQTPSEDVEFWYMNIKASYDELSLISDDTSQLEKTNVLMKLRETLTDAEGIIIPKGVSVFPSNTGFALWGCISFILIILLGFWSIHRIDIEIAYSESKKHKKTA